MKDDLDYEMSVGLWPLLNGSLIKYGDGELVISSDWGEFPCPPELVEAHWRDRVAYCERKYNEALDAA